MNGTGKGRVVSTSVSMSTEEDVNKEPPAGSTILKKTTRTEVEKIENGWIVSKNFDVKYMFKGETNWTYYTKKWYSETDPVTVTVDTADKSLADQFES